MFELHEMENKKLIIVGFFALLIAQSSDEADTLSQIFSSIQIQSKSSISDQQFLLFPKMNCALPYLLTTSHLTENKPCLLIPSCAKMCSNELLVC